MTTQQPKIALTIHAPVPVVEAFKDIQDTQDTHGTPGQWSREFRFRSHRQMRMAAGRGWAIWTDEGGQVQAPTPFNWVWPVGGDSPRYACDYRGADGVLLSFWRNGEARA